MNYMPFKTAFFQGFLFFISLFLVSSCQYHFGESDLSARYRTISIPYAEGDEKGELTTEVIKAISTSGALSFQYEGGDLTLKLKIIEISDENIGFRYDRNKEGHLRNTIIPTETRQRATVEVVLIDNLTSKTVRGPTRITATVDFDHDFYSSRNAINIFSLGQLTDFDVAQDTSMHSLNRILAEKISDYIVNSW